MVAASRSVWRALPLALLVGAVASAPSLAAGKRAPRAAPAPPPVALPCLSYAPSTVEVIGVLQREAFDKPAMEDLFVDPNDPEVEATPAAPPPPAATAPAASAPPTLGPDFIGPMLPAPPGDAPQMTIVDPALLRAKPVKRPPATETVWVLMLQPNICVESDPTDKINPTEKRVAKIQLVIDKNDDSAMRALQKKQVLIQGQLFHAVSRGQYLPVLINVATIRPPEWTPALTDVQPLPPLPTIPR